MKKDTNKIYLGHFADVLDFIPDESADAIITDPPYSEKYLYLWSALGKFAEKKLKPGGWLVMYSGHKNLPKVLNRLSKTSGLNYYWIMCLYHNGASGSLWHMQLAIRWKPILVYFKKPRAPLPVRNQPDYIVSGKRQKEFHIWQQSENGVGELIRIFTQENDLIIDPFAGGGTTAVVAENMKRKCIAAEIDDETYLKAKKRIETNNVATKHRFFR